MKSVNKLKGLRGCDNNIFWVRHIGRGYEAFSKKGAKITLEITTEWTNDNGTEDVYAVLSWEYWNGKSWSGIRVIDNTDRFHYSSEKGISFTCPDDIEKTEVNGEEKFWIRCFRCMYFHLYGNRIGYASPRVWITWGLLVKWGNLNCLFWDC